MTTTPSQRPVPSELPQDAKFNAGKIDEFVTSLAIKYIDRFGGEHYTIEGLKQLVLQQIYNLGWNPVGTFQDGATATAAGDIIQDESTGVWYRWDDLATLPKTVPAGSTPGSTGGTGEGKWMAVDVSDVLRNDLAGSSGASLIGVMPQGNLQQLLYWLTPEQFGAVGDGVADDSDAIQKWLAYGASMQTYLACVPERTYLIKSNYFRVYKNTIVEMNGAAIKSGSDFSGMYNGPTDGSNYAVGYEGDGNIKFRNGTFSNVLFAFAHSNNVAWENVRFKGLTDSHFIEINSTKFCRIINCDFSDHSISSGTGEYVEDVQIDAAISSAAFGAFGAYDGTVCEDVKFYGCRFSNTPKGIGSHSAPTVLHKNIVIDSCSFDGQTFCGIDAYWWGGFKIVNCSFANQEVFSIRIHGSCENWNVINVDFEGVNSQNHIIIRDYSTEKVKNGVITNSTFVNSSFCHIRGYGGDNIQIINTTAITSPGPSIYFSNGAKNIKVSTVLVRDCVTDVSNSIGCIHFDACTNTKINDVSVIAGNHTAIVSYNNHTDTELQYIDRVSGKVGTTGTYVAISGNQAVIDGKCYLTGSLNNTSGSGVVLSTDVRKFSHFIVASGAHGNGSHRSKIIMPDSKSTIVGVQFGISTASGTAQITFPTATTITYTSTSDNITYVVGVM